MGGIIWLEHTTMVLKHNQRILESKSTNADQDSADAKISLHGYQEEAAAVERFLTLFALPESAPPAAP